MKKYFVKKHEIKPRLIIIYDIKDMNMIMGSYKGLDFLLPLVATAAHFYADNFYLSHM